MFRFCLAAILFVPLVSFAEELSGLATADQEVSRPFCESFVAKMAVVSLSEAGYLKKGEVINDKNLDIKVIGFKKIGIEPQPPEVTSKDKVYLYEIVERVKVKTAKGNKFNMVVIAEVDTSECGVSSPLVILTAPEYKVLGTWESFLQSQVRFKDTPKGESSYPYPNLIK